uniref:Merozoite surface antigen 2 n=3 Tax=Plasmodium falciparum TaxID=5833 RepID=Q9U3V6_PLAFA|nr:membrane protein Pf7 [Plasmodium falciparum]AAK20864.1 merozoite surface antigen 2 [Plasmodium falciparum]
MKVIKTLSIINFFIFVTFNIKNESKYSNTFINNAYNMSIRRSMANEGSNTNSVDAKAPKADTIASGSQSSTNSASTSTTNNGESQTTTPTAADTIASGSQRSTNSASTSTTNNGESQTTTPTAADTPTATESNSPSPPITTTESSSSGNAPNKTDGKGEESEKQNELNESTEEGPKAPQEPQTAENENPAAPENKGTGQHGHMHGSRNNHPQNTSDSQKECTDGNKENCGAATSLLNNSSNIASINKFVVLISATLVLSFAIFI